MSRKLDVKHMFFTSLPGIDSCINFLRFVNFFNLRKTKKHTISVKENEYTTFTHIARDHQNSYGISEIEALRLLS